MNNSGAVVENDRAWFWSLRVGLSDRKTEREKFTRLLVRYSSRTTQAHYRLRVVHLFLRHRAKRTPLVGRQFCTPYSPCHTISYSASRRRKRLVAT